MEVDFDKRKNTNRNLINDTGMKYSPKSLAKKSEHSVVADELFSTQALFLSPEKNLPYLSDSQ